MTTQSTDDTAADIVVAAGVQGSRSSPVSLRNAQIAMALIVILNPLNSTLISLGLPAIRDQFDIGIGPVTLLVSGYLLTSALAQPIGGRLGDAFGHLRIMKISLAAALVAFIIAGLAWSFWLLLAMRLIQGMAAGLIVTNSLAYLRRVAPSSRLGTVLGWNATALQASGAIAPLLGGAVLALGEWRLLLFVNVPIVVAGLWAVARLPADRGAGRHEFVVDAASLMLLATFLTGLVLLGTAIREGSAALLWAGVLAPPLALAAYVARYRRAGTGLVELSLFSRRAFTLPSANAALLQGITFTCFIAMPLYVVEVRDGSARDASLLVFSLSAGTVSLALLSGQLSDRVGPRPLLAAASLLAMLSTGTLVAILHHPPLALLALPMLLLGMGFGLAAGAQQAAALGAWPRDRAGSASGTFSLVRQVGPVVGAGISAAAFGSDPTEGGFRLVGAIMLGGSLLALTSALLLPRASDPRQ